MSSRDDSPIVSPDDPRLIGMGEEAVAGADQIGGLLLATPDERLDGLVAILGFIEEARRAVRIELNDGVSAHIASLEDIIHSKEAANREKDRLALPTLRLLLQKIRERHDPPTR